MSLSIANYYELVLSYYLMVRNRPTSVLLLGLISVLAACGGDNGARETTSSTSVSSTTTTAVESTTTSEPSRLEQLGYPISDDWVVETVVAGIDAGTGGLAIDADGFMYQGDFGYPGHFGDAIYRISPEGVVDTLVESDEFRSLTMTTFGPDGSLYQSSYGTGDVFKVAMDGTIEEVATGLEGPTGIVALEDGSLFVEAYDSGVLHKILADGTVTEFARDAGFSGINGMTRGPDGTLYLVNHRNGGMFAVDQQGNVTQLHRFPGATSHVVYHDGSLFVTSRGSFVIYRWDLATGEAEIIAGNAEPGDQDGRGSESSFGQPNAITVGPDGALYINHGDGDKSSKVTIRRISLQP